MSGCPCCADDHGVYLVRSNQCPSTYQPGTDGQEVCCALLQPQQHSLLPSTCHLPALHCRSTSMSEAVVCIIALSGGHTSAAMQQRGTLVSGRKRAAVLTSSRRVSCPRHCCSTVLSADCCCVLPQELYPVTSKTAGTSNYTTPLNHVGVYYFVCQEDNHCIQGQVSSALNSVDQSQLIQNVASVVKADSVSQCAAQALCISLPALVSEGPSWQTTPPLLSLCQQSLCVRHALLPTLPRSLADCCLHWPAEFASDGVQLHRDRTWHANPCSVSWLGWVGTSAQPHISCQWKAIPGLILTLKVLVLPSGHVCDATPTLRVVTSRTAT